MESATRAHGCRADRRVRAMAHRDDVSRRGACEIPPGARSMIFEMNRRCSSLSCRAGAPSASVEGAGNAGRLARSARAGGRSAVALIDHLMPIGWRRTRSDAPCGSSICRIEAHILTLGEQLGSARELLERGFSLPERWCAHGCYATRSRALLPTARNRRSGRRFAGAR